jgi:hypothetical protein
MMRQIQEVEVIRKLVKIHKKVSTLSSFHIKMGGRQKNNINIIITHAD